MKKYKIGLVCLICLSVLISVIGLAFLNDIIPIHFNIKGEVDQYGSKYFILVITAITVICGLTILLIGNCSKYTENYRKYLLMFGNAIMVFFNAIILYFIIFAYASTDGTSKFFLSRLILPLIGVLLILTGNYAPKVEKNSTLGFKTKWAKYNDTTWQKTQRFGGFLSVVSGVLVIILSVFFNDIVNFIILMSIILIFVTTTVIASYYYYKQELKK